jgi:hypothetical protein
MSAFAAIIDQAHDTVASLHGVRVKYTLATTVNGVSSLRMTAVPTNPAGGVTVVDDAAMIESKSRDFLIRACDLRAGGARLMPQKGDAIQELDCNNAPTGYVYAVTQPAMADAPYRWHDRTRRILRVHTKETAVPA